MLEEDEVSVRANRTIYFPKSAHESGRIGEGQVFVYVDLDNGRIGIEPTSEDSPDSYRLIRSTEEGGLHLSCTSALSHFPIDWKRVDRPEHIRADYDRDEGFVEINLEGMIEHYRQEQGEPSNDID